MMNGQVPKVFGLPLPQTELERDAFQTYDPYAAPEGRRRERNPYFAGLQNGSEFFRSLPAMEISPALQLGFARCQSRTSLAVVGNALFFAELFDLFNVQLDADPENAFCLQSGN